MDELVSIAYGAMQKRMKGCLTLECQLPTTQIERNKNMGIFPKTKPTFSEWKYPADPIHSLAPACECKHPNNRLNASLIRVEDRVVDLY